MGTCLTGFRHKYSEARHDEFTMRNALIRIILSANESRNIPEENSPKALTNLVLFVKHYWLQYTKMQLIKIKKV